MPISQKPRKKKDPKKKTKTRARPAAAKSATAPAPVEPPPAPVEAEVAPSAAPLPPAPVEPPPAPVEAEVAPSPAPPPAEDPGSVDFGLVSPPDSVLPTSEVVMTAEVLVSPPVEADAPTAEATAAPEAPPTPPAEAPERVFRLPVVPSTPPAPADDVEKAVEDIRTLMTVDVAGTRQIDAFGRDPEFEKRAERILEVLYRRYFRVSVRNIEAIPEKGPVLLVANHSGSLPLDGAMLKLALSLDHPAHRRLRPLTENFVFHFPFVGTVLNRFGAVRACQENAEALLQAGEAVAVFPEGVKGLGKPFRKRYQLQRFGRGGFIRLALRTRTPIVPVAIVGAEETTPVIARLVRPGRTLGLPYLPVTPTFPFLGPLGLVPLPTKWTIEFGDPVMVQAEESADDLTIARLTEDIRGDIQGRLDKLLGQRKSWFG